MSALTDLFTSIANKIRSKLDEPATTKYSPSQFPAAIDSVYSKGVFNTKKGNAAAANVLQGKTFTSNTAGVNITGTMTDYSSSRITVTTDGSSSSSGKPAMRLYNGNYEIAMPTGYWKRAWADSGALIPAQEKTVTPTTSAVTVTPSDGKVLSKVTVSAITPVRTKGTYATGSGINSSDVPYVRFPYGWWAKESSSAETNYTYLTAAQAKAVHVHTTTYKPTTRKADIDMGEKHDYRYVNTTSVPNTNSGIYTIPASKATETKIEMGATNTYRYVNPSEVYSTGKTDGIDSVNNNGSFTLTCAAEDKAETITAFKVAHAGKLSLTKSEFASRASWSTVNPAGGTFSVTVTNKTKNTTLSYSRTVAANGAVSATISNKTIAYSKGDTIQIALTADSYTAYPVMGRLTYSLANS